MKANFVINKRQAGIIEITLTNPSPQTEYVAVDATDILDANLAPERVGLIRVEATDGYFRHRNRPSLAFLEAGKALIMPPFNRVTASSGEILCDIRISEDTSFRIGVIANQKMTVRLFLVHRVYIKRSDNPLFKQWSFAIKGGDEIVFESGEKEMNWLLSAVRTSGAEVSVFEIQQQSKRIKYTIMDESHPLPPTQ